MTSPIAGEWSFPALPRATTRIEVEERTGPLLPLIQEIDFHPACDIILATGSLVEGLGNVSSDVDFFVVNWSEVPLAREKKIVGRQGQRWVDVEYMDKSAVKNLHAKVTAERVLRGWNEGPGMSPNELDTYHRLALGVILNTPLCDLSDWPHFDQNALGRKVALGFYALARCRWLDAVGALSSGQSGQAWYAGREACERGMDAYLAVLGETNPNAKWLAAKLARVKQDPCGFRDLFWDVCLPARRDADAARRLLESVDSVLFQVSAALSSGQFRERRAPLHSKLRREVLPDGHLIELNVASCGRFIEVDEAERV